MAIKSKNSLTLIGWILLLTFGLGGLLSSLDRADHYLQKDYFHTDSFDSQLQEFIDQLEHYEFNNLPPEDLKKEVTVTTDEIEEHRYRYGGLEEQIKDIKNQYEEKIESAKAAQNQTAADLYTKERDEKVKDITENFKSDDYVKTKVTKEKEQAIDQYFAELEKHRIEFETLQQTFKYYLTDEATGRFYTNLNVKTTSDAEKRMKDMLYAREFPSTEYGYIITPSVLRSINNYISSNTSYANSPFEFGFDPQGLNDKDRRFVGRIAVSNTASPALSSILKEYNDYQKQRLIFFVIALSSLLALILSLFIYQKTLLKNVIKKYINLLQPKYNGIPIDICIAAFVFCGLFTLILLPQTYLVDLYYYGYIWPIISETFWRILPSAIFITLSGAQGVLLRQRIDSWANFKAEWLSSFCLKANQALIEAFAVRSIGTKVFLISFVIFASGFGLTVTLVEAEALVVYIPLFLIITLPTIILIVKRIGQFNRILLNTEELVKGNLETNIQIKGKSSLAKLAQNINSLKYGVKNSQIQQAKSERLKTELITNVSHDLRTPLTSIINYTGLLKNQELTEEDREAYIEVIDRKSKRLKVLIDDLFEVSKMASGSVELHKEKVDLGQLLQQALAEHDEAIRTSSLDFRVTTPNERIYSEVDGQKLWRVFDNLIGNILKYSLENTRIFIQLRKLNGNGNAELTFKNITKYELPENTEELFERSKRGDTSRHTEGSGLGLAIAKSIIDLHDGHMKIDVDGDLFKVTIILTSY